MTNFTTFLTTFMVTSCVWALLVLAKQQEIKMADYTDGNKTSSIVKLQDEIKTLKSTHKTLKDENDRLKEYKIKFKLLVDIENSKHLGNLRASAKVIDAVYRVSNETGYSVAFLMALVHQESSIQANPKPWRRVKGTVQINPSIWSKAMNIDIKQLSDPYYNLTKGVEILEHYLYGKAEGDMNMALHYYNNGITGKYNNDRYSGNIRDKEGYYREILKYR